MGRTLFLHVGTHKTGTTSLQAILANHEEKLGQYGAYLPKTGRDGLLPGHHNLAWELNDDERFDPAAGSLRDLCDELSQSPQPRAILSSEDFEYLNCRPDRLEMLRSCGDLLGYDIYVVVFFRDWVSYANSLYAELTKHNLTVGVEDFVQRIVEDGEFVFNGRWRFCFDYPRIVAGFETVFGEGRVLWSQYRRRIEEPFLDVVGLRALCGRLEGGYAANESIGPAAAGALLDFNREAERQRLSLDLVYETRGRILAEMSAKDCGEKFSGISGPLRDELDLKFQKVRLWLERGRTCGNQVVGQ